MATKKVKRFQEGGMSDKDRGLEASKDEKVGFFERLRMGNIDDPSSEAYRRFGAGRGRAESVPVEDRVATPVTRKTAAPSAAPAEMDELEAANARERIPVSAGPRAEMRPGGRSSVSVSSPAKPTASRAPAMQEQTYTRRGGATADELANYKPAARNQSLASQIPGNTGQSDAKPVVGENVEKMSDAERNISNILAATGVGAGAAGLLYKGKKMLDARKAAKLGAQKRADLKRAAEEGIDRNLADEFKSYSSSAAEKAIAAKADRARDLNAGQAKTKFTSESKKPSKKTKKFDDSESNVEFKRGGKAYASGGSVSAASKRADGIASRGKTRCKIC